MSNSSKNNIAKACFVLEKILLDLFAVGEIPNLFKPVMTDIRRKNGDSFNFVSTVDKYVVIRIADVEVSLRMTPSIFLISAGTLLSAIGNGDKEEIIGQIKRFVSNVYIHSIPSSEQIKYDIIAEIILPNITKNDYIKSKLGSASTLLNPGKTTNFLYRVTGMQPDDDAIGAINAISSQKGRMTALKERGCGLEYAATDNKTFEANLMFVDTAMPEIAASCLAKFFMDGITSVKSVTERVAAENPLGLKIGNLNTFYEHKMKTFLVDVALGMTPAKLWTGRYDANGGYLVVRGDGDIVCYHFYLRNEIENYLYNDTRFDSASRSRYDYGYLFRGEDGLVYMRLNLQIRFA